MVRRPYSDYYCLTNVIPKNVISQTKNLPICIATDTIQSTLQELARPARSGVLTPYQAQ